MTLRETHFIVVEDDKEYRDEVLNALLKAGLEYDNCLGEAETFAGARDIIDQHAKELDLVLLDLNLPREHKSGDTDKDFGYQLLDWVHNHLNSQPGVYIRVIIVSGEYSDYGVRDAGFRKQFDRTLVDIVPKKDLPSAIGRSLSALYRDDLLERITTLQIPIVDEYLIVVDPQQPALTRLQAAKDIACRLLMNEGDFRRQSLGSSDKYSDKLNNALKDLVEQRFEMDPNVNRRHPSIVYLKTGESWGHFIWRGLIYQHLYAINTYYNQYKHLSQQPYTSPQGTQDEWTIPKEDLDYFNEGQDVVQIVQVLVKELMRWYLPWHEGVYLKWRREGAANGGRGC